MKKDNRKKILVSCVCLLLLLAVTLYSKIEAQANSLDSITETTIVDYSMKSSYSKKEDGWIYVFKIYYPTGSNERVYNFNGYNLKYQELEEHKIVVVSETTNEVLYEVAPEYVSMVTSKKYQDEIFKIRDYFNYRQFDSEITVEELNDLNITVVSKQFLVEMFNEAISSNLEKVDGEYANAPFVGITSIESTDTELKGKWQAAYILKNGDIYDVNIEFIDENGMYLSDISESSMTQKEKETFNNIRKLEKNIIDSKSIYSTSNTIDSKVTFSSDIDKLLINLQKETE